MKVIIAGGSGQVGTILARHFHGTGHDLVVLSRSVPQAPWRVVPWDGVTVGPWTKVLDGCDVLINLAGRSVNCRYTQRNRREIRDSRVLSTQILHDAITTLDRPPSVWLNASTATIYRHALDRPMDEATGELGGNELDAPDTWRFSVEVAKAWENAFFATPTSRTRKVALRSAMTFSPNPGGVFDVFLSLVRHGLGGTIGPGTQYVSWIHETDFIRAIEFLIDRQELSGPVNLASPHPISNHDFLSTLRSVWGTRIGLPSARWMLEVGTFLMGTESELVLKSRQVVPGRLLESGFQFRFPTWDRAAEDLVRRWRLLHQYRSGQ